MKIYISRDDEQFGPYTAEEVRDYLAQGALWPSDLAWHEGLENWVDLDQIALPCPAQRTPPPPSKIPPQTGAFKSMSPLLARGIMGGTSFTSSFLNGFIIIPTSLNDDLTRETAAELLQQQLAAPRISQLVFIEGGIDRAKADGLVAESQDFKFFGRYTFTIKDIEFINRLVSADDQIHRAEDDKRGTAKTPFFELSYPIGERVEEVTGITAGPLGSRILIVEYVSAYVIPPEMEIIIPYIYTGQRVSAAFQKYDDGWRVVGDI
jgi:hypothetical protein